MLCQSFSDATNIAIKLILRSIVCAIHLVYWPPSRDLFPVESDQWIPVINTTLTCWTTNKDKMAKSDSLQCKIFLFCSQKNLVGIYILHKSRDPKISIWSVQQLYNVSIKSALLWSQAMMLWTRKDVWVEMHYNHKRDEMLNYSYPSS